MTMPEPYVLSALFSMASAIFIACGAYILLRAVKRIGRIGEDLLRSIELIENLGPNSDEGLLAEVRSLREEIAGLRRGLRRQPTIGVPVREAERFDFERLRKDIESKREEAQQLGMASLLPECVDPVGSAPGSDEWLSELEVNNETILLVAGRLAAELEDFAAASGVSGCLVEPQLANACDVLSGNFHDLILVGPIVTGGTSALSIRIGFNPQGYRRIAEAAKDFVRASL